MVIDIYWIVFYSVMIIGYGYTAYLASKCLGDWDMITPIIVAGSFVITTIILIMALLGKYVF